MRFILVVFSIIFSVISAYAADDLNSQNEILKLPSITAKLGIYNVVRELKNNDRKDDATNFSLEYRDKTRFSFEIKPIAGILYTSKDDLFIYAGIMKSFALPKDLNLNLSIAPGYYNYGGKDKDLDNKLEFKSEIELAYKFSNGQDLGLAFAHISNASLGPSNPGVEILSVNYTIPVNLF